MINDFPQYKWALDAQQEDVWALHADGVAVNCHVSSIEDQGRKIWCVSFPFDSSLTRRFYGSLDEAKEHTENAWTDIHFTPHSHRYARGLNLRIEDLDRVKGLVKVKKLAELAGLSASSIAQKVGRSTQLTIDESEAMTRVLREMGVVIECRPTMPR